MKKNVHKTIHNRWKVFISNELLFFTPSFDHIISFEKKNKGRYLVAIHFL